MRGVWEREDPEMSDPKHCQECGAIQGKVRSLPDHRRFFKVLSEAFSNWPHDHDFQPISSEHLRAYLLAVECGYAKATPICEAKGENVELVSEQLKAAVAAALGEGDFAFVRVMGGWHTVLRPKSINFRTLSQRDFGPLREAVEGVIEIALGVSAQELLRAEAA